MPKTYLGPVHEQIAPPPCTPWGWLISIFAYEEQEMAKMCGLDAYFFLRYLRTLLILFLLLSVILLPVLVPLNYVGGRGYRYALEFHNVTSTSVANVTGMDQYAWGNVRPTHASRYWAHLILAILVIVCVCGMFFEEFRELARKRQEYLTSREYRSTVSAASLLVSSIPKHRLSHTSLANFFGVFPGGVRTIWINRKFDTLQCKIREREAIHAKLESAETTLIQKAEAAHERAVRASVMLDLLHTKTEPPSRVVAARQPSKHRRGTSDGTGDFNALAPSQGGDGHDIDSQLVLTPPTGRSPNGAGLARPPGTWLERAKNLLSVSPAADYADDEDHMAVAWQRYVSKHDRPRHSLPLFDWTPNWIPGLPLLNKRVDTIYWCRRKLLRLNMEIEQAQQRPDRFPLARSAFIQFHRQRAAHLASQMVSRHKVGRVMAPRVGVLPRDIIWHNMSVSWWESWLRFSVVTILMAGFVILWALPVIWTAYLSQMTSLIGRYHWLYWLNGAPHTVLRAISGILPALTLSIVLAIVPSTLNYLASLSGAPTGTQIQEYVQNFYFAFLFIQVFLIVSISRGAFAALVTAPNITTVPDTLGTELPKAANYFFSYMILQALSVSSGNLLQPQTLVSWLVASRWSDKTAREKWMRNTTLSTITWSTFFPVYTNLACITLIYSIVSPLIILFAIVTFGLLWITNRYNALYVIQFRVDTGGLLYRTAINQTFTGLYFMELCLVGLFFLVQNDVGKPACVPQAIIMIVAVFLTAIYQIALNVGFAPLINHPPAVLEDKETSHTNFPSTHTARGGEFSGSFWDKGISEGQNTATEAPRGLPPSRTDDDASKGGFQHYALRAKSPTVWIPGDSSGVSDGEVRATEIYGRGRISITNKGASLDNRQRVVCDGH